VGGDGTLERRNAADAQNDSPGHRRHKVTCPSGGAGARFATPFFLKKTLYCPLLEQQ